MNANEIVKTRTQQRCFQRCTATWLFNSFMHLYNVCHFLAPISLSLLFLLSRFLKKMHEPLSLIIVSWPTMGGTLFPGVKATQTTHQGYTTEKKTLSPAAFNSHGFNGGVRGSTPPPSTWKHWGSQSWARRVKETTAALSQYTWWLCRIQKTSFCRKYPNLCFLDSS